MYVRVTDSAWGLERCVLMDPHDLSELHVSIAALDLAEVHRALRGEFAGEPADEDHVWLSIDWLERTGAGSWDPRDFAAMIAKARNAGWVDPQQTELRAHVARGAIGAQ